MNKRIRKKKAKKFKNTMDVVFQATIKAFNRNCAFHQSLDYSDPSGLIGLDGESESYDVSIKTKGVL